MAIMGQGLVDLLDMREDESREKVRSSHVKGPKRRGLLRTRPRVSRREKMRNRAPRSSVSRMIPKR